VSLRQIAATCCERLRKEGERKTCGALWREGGKVGIHKCPSFLFFNSLHDVDEGGEGGGGEEANGPRRDHLPLTFLIGKGKRGGGCGSGSWRNWD